MIATRKERGWSVLRTTPARCDGCKPDSVRPGCPGLDGHFSQEPQANSWFPPVLRRVRRYPGSRFTEVKLRSWRPLPLFCLAPHRVYHAPVITHRAVGSYPAFSPLPQSCDRGGIFSVTLSVDRDFRPDLPRVLRGMLPCGVRTFLQDYSQRSSTVTLGASARSGLNATQRENDETSRWMRDQEGFVRRRRDAAGKLKS